MNSTFEFVGKIIPCKETENFKPYNSIRFKDSDWGKKTIKFNMVCGTNRHFLEVSDLVNMANEKSMKIYTFSKGTQSDDGTKNKGEKLEVSFADRLKPEIVEKVAEFKKYVVDTEIAGRRYKLEKAIDKFKDGSITDEQMKEFGVNSIEECEKALKESKTKKHEFISAYDFIDFLNKLVNNDKIKDMIFKVTGNYEVDYDSKNDVWYRHFIPQRIYRTDDNATPISQCTFGITFGRETVDDTNFEDKKKIHINGFIPQYLSNYKKTFFCPMTFTIDGNGDEKAEKKALGFKKKFTFTDECSCDYREIGIVCDILDGAQKVELTEDMLTDEQRENLEFGLCTMEDIVKELGKDVYGDKVTDVVINTLARGYSSGAKDTVYTDKDFCKPHIETNEKANNTDTEEDIFNEDIDI